MKYADENLLCISFSISIHANSVLNGLNQGAEMIEWVSTGPKETHLLGHIDSFSTFNSA